MKPSQIFSKTLPFAWAKLLLGIATVLASAVIFAVLMGIAWLFKSDGVYTFMFIIWLAATGIINFLLNHYVGYLLKAGHVAVITEAVMTGSVPNNQVEYGKQMVKERFLTSNVYFLIDKLVSSAVKQIQRVFEKAGGIFSAIPGMQAVTNVASMFIGIALGYIDECCLGYTFLKKEQNAFKSAADGIAIYAQNWKKLLKDAAKTTAMVIIFVVVVTLVLFLLFAGIVRLFGSNQLFGVVAFILAVLVSWTVKKAFIDSYILVNMVASYMEAAPATEFTSELYNKLCGWSAKFKELFNKGQQENPAANAVPAYAAAGTGTKMAEIAAAEKPVFCGECGAKNPRGTKFCGSCGKPL